MNFQTPSEDGYGLPNGRQNLAAFLENNTPNSLRPVTAGMFGYSATRPVMSKQYFHGIYDHSIRADCHLDSWHTESGPGVYEGV
jgi:glutamine synthetase